MRLLPSYRFTVRTPAPIDVVRERLRADVARYGATREGGRTLFRGDVWDSGFRLTRVLGYRNGFVPLLVGRFESVPGGTRVTVSVRLTAWSAAFACCWSGLLVP